jgi:hypothetical protein
MRPFDAITPIQLPASMAAAFELFANEFQRDYPERKLKLVPHFGFGEVCLMSNDVVWISLSLLFLHSFFLFARFVNLFFYLLYFLFPFSRCRLCIELAAKEKSL